MLTLAPESILRRISFLCAENFCYEPMLRIISIVQLLPESELYSPSWPGLSSTILFTCEFRRLVGFCFCGFDLQHGAKWFYLPQLLHVFRCGQLKPQWKQDFFVVPAKLSRLLDSLDIALTSFNDPLAGVDPE